MKWWCLKELYHLFKGALRSLGKKFKPEERDYVEMNKLSLMTETKWP